MLGATEERLEVKAEVHIQRSEHGCGQGGEVGAEQPSGHVRIEITSIRAS